MAAIIERVRDQQPDDELVLRAQAKHPDAIRTIIRRYNQRLYRLARAIVRNDEVAEEVLQEAYLKAFAALDCFRGDASLATWLSRITINEALGRLRRQRRFMKLHAELAGTHQAAIIPFPGALSTDDPERTMAQRQLLQLVERACDDLPEVYRLVFVARVIEGLSVAETAAALNLQAGTVKTRLHRARTLLRRGLEAQIGPLLLDAFPFAGKRCERLTAIVMKKIASRGP
ncbi:RNA polymerase sigma factor [Chelativorans sp. Marseille-P2723]|uniref:RNA polymerase sigma factor n=1 Tax=Chelativorans sp. Marseille-P2723 TaxID=2709133 RepID=UPI00156FF098|nr:RNA polymerase sigma factor [Chelativorans sp. Marseille-P2723]